MKLFYIKSPATTNRGYQGSLGFFNPQDVFDNVFGKNTHMFASQVSPKIWKLKEENKYRVPYYSNDIDDGIFYYKVYRKSLFKPYLSR